MFAIRRVLWRQLPFVEHSSTNDKIQRNGRFQTFSTRQRHQAPPHQKCKNKRRNKSYEVAVPRQPPRVNKTKKQTNQLFNVSRWFPRQYTIQQGTFWSHLLYVYWSLNIQTRNIVSYEDHSIRQWFFFLLALISCRGMFTSTLKKIFTLIIRPTTASRRDASNWN